MPEYTHAVLYLLGLEMAAYLEDPLNYQGDRLYWLIDEAVKTGGLAEKKNALPYWTVIDDKGIDISPSRTHGFPSRDYASRFASGFYGGEVRLALCEPASTGKWSPDESHLHTVETKMGALGIEERNAPSGSGSLPSSQADRRQRMAQLGITLIEGGKPPKQ